MRRRRPGRPGLSLPPGRIPGPGPVSPGRRLIILDLRLPKIDGLEVLKTIKADANLGQIPVVVLTTSSAEWNMVKAYENHANSYLVKPVDFPQFLKLMESLGYYWLAWNQYPFEHSDAGVLPEKQP